MLTGYSPFILQLEELAFIGLDDIIESLHSLLHCVLLADQLLDLIFEFLYLEPVLLLFILLNLFPFIALGREGLL